MTRNFSSFSIERFEALLGNQRLGKHLHFFDETSSTNERAKEAIRKKQATHGWLALADHQTHGRGRRGNVWSSPKGSSLLFSIVLNPTFSFESWPRITLAAALSICEMIDEWAPQQAQIKWPNDVWVKGRKISGILAESLIFGDQSSLILGIGINIHQNREDFPEELRHSSTSLELISEGKKIDRTEALAIFLSIFEPYLGMLEDAQWKTILSVIKQRSALIGNAITWIQEDQEHHGYAENLDEEGRLVVILPNGERQTLFGVDHLRLR